MTSALPTPRKAQRITTQTVTLSPKADSSHPQGRSSPPADNDPIIPSINAYGTFDPHKLLSKSRVSSSPTNGGLRHSSSHASQLSSISTQSQHQPLLPSSHPTNDNMMDQISGDLIPFAGTISMLRRQFAPLPLEVLPPGVSVSLLNNRNHNSSNRGPGPSNRRSRPDTAVLTHNPICVNGKDLCTQAHIRSIAQQLRVAGKTFPSRF